MGAAERGLSRDGPASALHLHPGSGFQVSVLAERCPAMICACPPPAVPGRWPPAATSPASAAAGTPPPSSSPPPSWSPCPGPSSAPTRRTRRWALRRRRRSGATSGAAGSPWPPAVPGGWARRDCCAWAAGCRGVPGGHLLPTEPAELLPRRGGQTKHGTKAGEED